MLLDDGTPLGDLAWYCGNSDDTTHEVGALEPNAWGLHDTSGNVWEWVHDWYDDYPDEAITDPVVESGGPARVDRGGSWNNKPRNARVSARDRNEPGYRNCYLGFRLARSNP